MKHYFTILLALTFSSLISAQMLTLESEGKQKTFPSLHELTIYTSNNKSKLDYFRYNGQLIRVENDSVTLRLSILLHEIMSKDEKTIMHEHHFKHSPDLPEFITIAKGDIFEIENFKSEKKMKSRKSRSRLGALLCVGGILTFATSYIIENKSDRKTLRQLSGAEFGSGLILGITSGTKGFDTWNKWQIK